MQGDMRFGGAEVDEGQRQFGVAVVSIGENAVGHHKANHAITHHLLKALGQVLRQSLCNGFDDFFVGLPATARCIPQGFGWFLWSWSIRFAKL